MNKKNVLHVLDLLEPGGAQILMKGIFEHQADDETIFLLSLRKIDVEIEVQHPNCIQSNAKQKYSVSSIKEFKQVIENNNIQIVHCHLFKSQIFGWLLKKMYFPNITLIFHEHGQIFHNDFLTNQIFTRFLKRTHSDIDGFIAITDATKYKLMGRAKVPAHKIKRLYNFINVEKFTPNLNVNKETERKKFNIKQDAFVVGFAARLIERKGWEDFVYAAKLLENHSNIQFLVAGDGEDKEKMLAVLQKNNIENVEVLGYIENLDNIILKAKLVVAPMISGAGIQNKILMAMTLASSSGIRFLN